jgi:uncharacterized protein YndB with AHSA1/START domain
MNDTKTTVTLPSDLEVAMTRSVEAPRPLVFDAFTKPEHIRRWLGRQGDTMPICEVDLRVGGAWRYVWSLREGGEMGMRGEFREIVAPERIVTTEEFDEPFFEAMGAGTINTTTFEERDGKTRLTITALYKSREARDSALQTGMEDGLDEGFGRLAELLQTLQSSSAARKGNES